MKETATVAGLAGPVPTFPKGKTIRTALIYDGELVQTIEASGYFNALVNIREILF